MNQLSAIGFGVDADVFAGYAQSANDRLGDIDLVVENTGSTTLYMVVRQYDGNTSPSGFANVGDAFVVVPGGTQSKHFNLLNKRIGFFGSGNTATDLSGTATSAKANISTALRNKADLRGAQISIVAGGRRGWGFDEGFDSHTLAKKFGTPPDFPSEPPPSGGGGYAGS